jgi:hypothetical protein
MSNIKHLLENYNELIRDYYYEREQSRIWEAVAYLLHEDCYCDDAVEHLTAMAEKQKKRKL